MMFKKLNMYNFIYFAAGNPWVFSVYTLKSTFKPNCCPQQRQQIRDACDRNIFKPDKQVSLKYAHTLPEKLDVSIIPHLSVLCFQTDHHHSLIASDHPRTCELLLVASGHFSITLYNLSVYCTYLDASPYYKTCSGTYPLI